MKGLSHARPKGVARIKTELIDLDLIRGSAFTKAKPQQGFIATTYLGIIRVVLFPFYLKWWSNQTNSFICALLFLLYGLQLSSMYIYFNYHSLVTVPLPTTESFHTINISSTSSSQSGEDGTKLMARSNVNTDFDEIPASEVLVPVVMFVILSVIQSNIAASHSLDERNRRNHPGSRTRSRSQLNEESGVDLQPRARSSSIRLAQNAQSSKKSSISGPSTVKRRKRRSPEKKVAEVRIKDSRKNDGVPVIEKKPSDEESGLEVLESITDQPPHCLRHRRNFKSSELLMKSTIKPVAEVPSNEEESSPIKHSNQSSPVTKDERSSPEGSIENTPATGDEGDHEGDDEDAHVDDMSSQDEVSPYSTVNSLENNNWYGEFVSQRFRSMSQSTIRRFSNSAAEPARRQRSGTLLRSCSGHKVPSAVSNFPHQAVHTNSDSCDSEGSMSPTTPNKGVATDMEWPMINSEGTSEDEDDDDVTVPTTNNAQPPTQSISVTIVAEQRSTTLETENTMYTGPISAPPFYYPDDPDSLPPTIFSFCDDWMLGSRNCDKKNNDKGKIKSYLLLHH